MKDIVLFDEHEQAADDQRFKKEWIQSTPISDNIGTSSRFSEVIVSSINYTRNQFKENVDSPSVDRFIKDIKESCVKGGDTFNGSLIGAEVS